MLKKNICYLLKLLLKLYMDLFFFVCLQDVEKR